MTSYPLGLFDTLGRQNLPPMLGFSVFLRHGQLRLIQQQAVGQAGNECRIAGPRDGTGIVCLENC